MFRITRGITLDHAPAYPSPALRFPDGTPVPIHVGEAPTEDRPTGPESTAGKGAAEQP